MHRMRLSLWTCAKEVCVCLQMARVVVYLATQFACHLGMCNVCVHEGS
jgi:hypothetical protein